MAALTIIYVNFNSGSFIAASIASIYATAPDLNADIIVIDNSDSAHGCQLITGRYPKVRWINAGYNAGFARANNLGIRQASGDLILLLNPDTLAVDDSITRCAARLRTDEAIAAGVQLLDAAGQPQISGSQFFKWGLNHLLPIPFYGNLLRSIAFGAGSGAPGVRSAAGRVAVDWISGAFLMVKRAAIETAGLLDEDFFLYAEEVEWCARLRKVGGLCLYGNLKMVHLEGATINASQRLQEKGYYNLYDKKGLQLMVSNHLRVRKQYGVLAFLFLLLNYTAGIFIFAGGILIHKLSKKNHAIPGFRKWAQYTRNVLRLWALAPTIMRNRPHFYKMF